MTELSIHIPRELSVSAESLIEEQQLPLIPADRIGRGILHPDRLPPSIPTLTQVYEAILEHEQTIDPHGQYATDSDLTTHASNEDLHIPPAGIGNDQIAADAAIEWSKISKVGAVPSDVGAMPMLGTIDQQVGSVKPTVRSTGAVLQVGDRWLDTADRIWWFWNGTYWLSEEIFVARTVLGTVAATTALGNLERIANYNCFILNFTHSGQFDTPQDATNYWEIRLERANTSATRTTVGNLLTSFNLVSSSVKTLSTTINTHLDLAALDVQAFRVAYFKTGSAGNLVQFASTTQFRLAKP